MKYWKSLNMNLIYNIISSESNKSFKESYVTSLVDDLDRNPIQKYKIMVKLLRNKEDWPLL
jgi:hypothetical protein